jgi:hypothetical protein
MGAKLLADRRAELQFAKDYLTKPGLGPKTLASATKVVEERAEMAAKLEEAARVKWAADQEAKVAKKAAKEAAVVAEFGAPGAPVEEEAVEEEAAEEEADE